MQRVVARLCRSAAPPVPFFSLTTRGGRYGRLVAELVSHSWRPAPPKDKDQGREGPAKRQVCTAVWPYLCATVLRCYSATVPYTCHTTALL